MVEAAETLRAGPADLGAGDRFPEEGRDLPKVTRRGGGSERTGELCVVTRGGVTSFPLGELTSLASAVSGVFSPYGSPSAVSRSAPAGVLVDP